ncbi:thioredoxin [candidate division WWE3 bacterium]|jgi:thioredoxin|nr:thioredoxin [candidate division WWE3 bacterium]MBT7350345.1 thioredoxin [candidate division WWE3 bacterium]
MITLTDFYADWCGPCKVMKPIFAEIEKDYEGKVEFKQVDVEAETAEAAKFGVMSIPTFVITKDGQEVDRKMGAMPKDALTSWLDSHLS